MHRLVTATAIALAVASTASAQQATSEQTAQQQQQSRAQAQTGATQPTQQSVTGRIPVESAEAIVGRLVRDNSGSPAGEVEYVLISTTTGAVQSLVIGSAGLLELGEEELTAVPWRMVAQIPGEGDIRLDVSKSQLNRAPRITEETIAELTRPAIITEIVNFYAQPQGQGQQAQQQAQAQRPQQRGQQQAQRQQQPQRQQQQAQQQPSGQGEPQILIGQSVITTLAPPMLARPLRMEGMNVISQTGEDVGEIDHVMIDTTRGAVAYVLLARGGFLGIGENWVPVPLGALQWTPQEDTYRVTASAQAIEQIPALQRDELPERVSAAQLQSLYQRFSIAPYWQQTAETPQTGQSGMQPERRQ